MNRKFLWVVLSFALAGCAAVNGRGLTPGQSTARDVEALMGAPAERATAADGDTLWYYPRQPMGRETYVARLAPNGVLRSVEQVLTEENLKRISAGTTTAKQLRELLGPPWQVSHNARMEREVWQYNMVNATLWDYFLYVQFSRDGIVREVLLMKDYTKETGGGKD